MGKKSTAKKEKAERIKALRKKYEDFIDEDKKRKERNEDILGRLDKMRYASLELRYSSKMPGTIPRMIQYNVPDQANTIIDMVPIRQQSSRTLTTPISLDENDLIKKISEKYILIPKSTAIILGDENIIQPKISNEDDWTSKYEILNKLNNKKEEVNDGIIESGFKNKIRTKHISFENDSDPKGLYNLKRDVIDHNRLNSSNTNENPVSVDKSENNYKFISITPDTNNVVKTDDYIKETDKIVDIKEGIIEHSKKNLKPKEFNVNPSAHFLNINTKISNDEGPINIKDQVENSRTSEKHIDEYSSQNTLFYSDENASDKQENNYSEQYLNENQHEQQHEYTDIVQQVYTGDQQTTDQGQADPPVQEYKQQNENQYNNNQLNVQMQNDQQLYATNDNYGQMSNNPENITELQDQPDHDDQQYFDQNQVFEQENETRNETQYSQDQLNMQMQDGQQLYPTNDDNYEPMQNNPEDITEQEDQIDYGNQQYSDPNSALLQENIDDNIAVEYVPQDNEQVYNQEQYDQQQYNQDRHEDLQSHQMYVQGEYNQQLVQGTEQGDHYEQQYVQEQDYHEIDEQNNQQQEYQQEYVQDPQQYEQMPEQISQINIQDDQQYYQDPNHQQYLGQMPEQINELQDNQQEYLQDQYNINEEQYKQVDHQNIQNVEDAYYQRPDVNAEELDKNYEPKLHDAQPEYVQEQQNEQIPGPISSDQQYAEN